MKELQNDKILLVDDENDILEFLGYNFALHGMDVYSSSNGRDAIEMAKRIVPKFVIPDVMMTDLNGFETCAELRRIPTLYDTMITFLSAKGDTQSQVLGFQAGADDYLEKPINLQSILFHLIEMERNKFQESIN